MRGPESGASEKIVLGAGAQCGPKPPLRSRNQYAWAPVRWTGVSATRVINSTSFFNLRFYGLQINFTNHFFKNQGSHDQRSAFEIEIPAIPIESQSGNLGLG